MTDAERSVQTARARWNAATTAWSRDDGMDMVKTVRLGEEVMFSATALICCLEDVVDERAGR